MSRKCKIASSFTICSPVKFAYLILDVVLPISERKKKSSCIGILKIYISCSISQNDGHRLWDVRTGTIVRTLETKSSVTSAEVSQDSRYITTADGSNVKFWDANQ